MNAARRVALILHALAPSDREWLLDRMAPARRETLRALLDELAELGIAGDSRLVRELVADTTSELEQDPIAVIAGASAAAAVEALASESAALIEWILSLHVWPWRDALLGALGRAKREHIESLAASRLAGQGWGAEALRDASLRELAAHLGAIGVDVAPPKAERRLPGWMRFGGRA
jgi:hypothetical protein